MARDARVIDESTRITSILEECIRSDAVFEATDAQQNIYSLGLQKINGSRTSRSYVKPDAPMLAQFRLLQQGPAEMRVNCDYVLSFHHLGKIHSLIGRLLSADPEHFNLTYRLEERLHLHQLRRYRRLVIESLDRVSAEVGNRVYPLLNMSLGGVGLVIHEPDLFRIGQELPVKLLSEGRILEATGSVRHVGPLSDDGYICGVSLNYHDKKSLNHIRDFIWQARENRKDLFRLNLLLR